MRYKVFIIPLCISLAACATPHKDATLSDIDIVHNDIGKNSDSSIQTSNDAIRKAYADYLQSASKNDISRLTAINRLAELEFELGNRVAQEKNSLAGDSPVLMDETYNARLDTTIKLITTSLREYPNASGNDKLLYNLANAYDQQGKIEPSLAALTTIINKYPRSKYYLESQFRVAEGYFSKGEYIAADDAYTNVISTPKNGRFIEKSYFKRGWSRLKLEYYAEAADDYINAVAYHGFSDIDNLSSTEKDLFNEYFRAIGLSFAYMQNLDEITAYFKERPAFSHIYNIYSSISDIYLKQNRYSDSARALAHFSEHFPTSPYVPESQVKLIESWKLSGFTQKTYDAIDLFYTAYNPDSAYWTENSNPALQKSIANSLKEYTLLMMANYHSRYQSTHQKQDFSNADQWYKRYLSHFSQYSRKDNVHFLYAELLAENKSDKEALYHYEKAAYNDDIILNKRAAYSTILITSQLHRSSSTDQERSSYLDRNLQYSRAYAQLYPNDELTPKVIAHAAELAFKAKQYANAIELTNLVHDSADAMQLEEIRTIRGHSYFESGQFSNAETTYTSILKSSSSTYKARYQIGNQLALSIYKQGLSEKSNGNTQGAIEHLMRISKAAPDAGIAADAANEAIDLAITNELWDIAIGNIKIFQAQFPNHSLNNAINIKLSSVYLKSGQEISAAREYEKIALAGGDAAIKMAAQWKAAELYEANDKTAQAISAYKAFATTYQQPYAQHLEAMQKLVTLYTAEKEMANVDIWQHAILDADKNGSRDAMNSRTKFITSTAALNLAIKEFGLYKTISLTLPLRESLDKKKAAMQKAVRLFGQASGYGVAETSTQAKHSIGEIYQLFNHALIKSERPNNLNEEELEQYNLLLEDQAFPFEEKAIEFFEANMAHISDGVYDSWIQRSHDQLKLLFPARYLREAKVDDYVDLLH